MKTQDLELGYLAHPATGRHPGVIMIHDVWGLADHTRDLARRLAAEGFAVLAVDLYRREATVEITDPGAWMKGLSDVQVLEDLEAAAAWLAELPAVDGGPVGITGFCMGGMYALLAACSCTGLAASVPFYGLLSHQHGILHSEEGLDPARKPREPLDAAADLGCPLLAFFGDQDDFVPLSDIEELRDRLGAASHPADVVVYPGAGHAFMNDTRPEAHRPEIARQAWARMVEFLRKRLP